MAEISEPQGRGGAWTEEPGLGDEGPPPEAARQAGRHLEAPRRRAEDRVIRALAVTVSNRASAGVYGDKSGPVLVELMRSAGCAVVDGPLVIPDGDPVEAALRDALAAGYDVVVTTGGTGLTPGDLTPEMTRRVLDREIPGIAEALRSAGAAAGVASAILSRGLAGVAGRTLIVNLPGSTGGVRDGMAVLAPVLAHAVSQINGGDHAGLSGRVLNTLR
jgi:molybdenum cofactor synthesis domain-containing protein